MKTLFDHNVPKRLRARLEGLVVVTAKEMGWAELENGFLLKAAEDAGFELMITCDQNLSYQQNLSRRKLALIVLSTNNWPRIAAHAESIRATIDTIQPQGFVKIAVP